MLQQPQQLTVFCERYTKLVSEVWLRCFVATALNQNTFPKNQYDKSIGQNTNFSFLFELKDTNYIAFVSAHTFVHILLIFRSIIYEYVFVSVCFCNVKIAVNEYKYNTRLSLAN